LKHLVLAASPVISLPDGRTSNRVGQTPAEASGRKFEAVKYNRKEICCPN
jgi:hypothetical protein